MFLNTTFFLGQKEAEDYTLKNFCGQAQEAMGNSHKPGQKQGQNTEQECK